MQVSVQAIATAKRLGARVEAFDPRPAVKEQVKSLGASFIDMELPKDAETAELARLRLASIRLDEKKFDEALKLLETKHSAALETLYADLRGDIMVAQGKTAEARAAYKMAIEKSLPNSSYRSVVQIKLDALGGEK